MKITKKKLFPVETNDVADLVLTIIKKYIVHRSILKFKGKINYKVFSFQNVTLNKYWIKLRIRRLRSQQSRSRFEIIKGNSDIFVKFILENFSKDIRDGKFHNHFKK